MWLKSFGSILMKYQKVCLGFVQKVGVLKKPSTPKKPLLIKKYLLYEEASSDHHYSSRK